mmetsp:Transcript_32898/g.97932  ORF Transcript_32898/g.97932 Transcript_32898/m.97932 type:complete len:228 (+) Transcript_32898:243-926(+)
MQTLELSSHLLGLHAADVFGHGLQRCEVGHGSLGGLPDLELRHLLTDEPLCLDDLRLPLLSVGLHNLLQVIHRVGKGALNILAVSRDVAGHGNVNKHQIPLERAEVSRRDDWLLAGCSSEDNVALPDYVPHAVERRHLGVAASPRRDLVKQCLRLVRGPVHHGHVDVPVLAEEGDEQKPGHLPSAHNADMHLVRVLAQVRKCSGHHKLHGRAGHGHGALADLRARPY